MNNPDWSILYCLQSLAAGIVSGSLGAYLIRHWKIPEDRPLVLLLFAVSQWSFSYAMEYGSPGLESKLFWVRMEYAGSVWVSPLFLVFVLRIVGKCRALTQRRLAALLMVPAITLAGAWSNGFHHLIWSVAWLNAGNLVPVVSYVRGPLFWLYLAFSYALLLCSTCLLVKAFTTARGMYRKQLGIILLASLVPWLANVLYMSDLSPAFHADFTPFAFMLSGLMLAYAMSRYRLLDLRPIAREAVMEDMADAVLVLDTQDRLVDLNSAAAEQVGGRKGDIIGKQAGHVLPDLYPLMAQDRTDRQMEGEIRLGQGAEMREYELRVSPLFHRRGHRAGRLVILRDISERKQAEARLRFTQFAIDHLYEAAFWVHPDGRFIYVNEAATRLLGYTREELLAKMPRDIIPDFTRIRRRKIWAATVTHGSNVFESRLRTKEGDDIPVEISVNLLEFKGGYYSCAFARDITQRKQAEAEQSRLEARLQRARKMEAIGTLAGGVAHDLNNILSGIMTYPDLLLLQVPADSPLRKSLETIRKTGERAAAIVQDLLTLARRGVYAEETVLLNDVVSSYLNSPEHENLLSFHPAVTVQAKLDPSLLPIQGSRLHLHKTVMNLVSNAAEAMEDGGEIHLHTENLYVDRPVWGYDDVHPGDYVRLTVSDTGTGISEEDRERIFEPFYTKKVMGRSGTGLGMSVVWGTVRDHNGYIDLKSRAGKGTCFHLYFPASRESRIASLPTAASEVPTGNGESILIVDDAIEQREIARSILMQLGYGVATVDSGEEALRFLKRHSADLVLLDMIMEPGMDGLACYQEIVKFRPSQKAVIVSGFSENDRVRRAQTLGAGPYVKKPYSLETLGREVRNELDRVRTPPP